MNDESARAAVLAGLDRLTDEDLQEVVKQAGSILAAREKERKAEALREIQKIAKAHGLNVDIKDVAPRKRGRPVKTAEKV